MASLTLDKSKVYYIGDLTESQKEKLFKEYKIYKKYNDKTSDCIVYSGANESFLLSFNLNEFINKKNIINLAELLKKEDIKNLGFTLVKDGFYSRTIGSVEIWVKTKIFICEDRESVELFDYSYERLKKLLDVWED